MIKPQNSIPEIQNEARQIDYLAAQRYLYAKAKTANAAEAVLSVPLPVIVSLAGACLPPIAVFVAAYSIAVWVIGRFWLDRYATAARSTAAKIQEEFDCYVLQLPWSQIKVGEHAPPEEVLAAARAYKRQCQKGSSHKPLPDWYPVVVGSVPLDIARIICQRTNLSWDSRLRRRYVTVVLVVLGLIALDLLVSALIADMKFTAGLLAFGSPLLPVVNWAWGECRRQKDTADHLDELRRRVEGAWGELLRGLPAEQALDLSRAIQDETYQHRQTAQPIFDFVYNRLRADFEQDAKQIAAQMVEEAKGALTAKPA